MKMNNKRMTWEEETIRQLDKEIEEWKTRVKEDKNQNLYHCPITLCAKKYMKSFLEEKVRKTNKKKNKIIGKFLIF
ncbi:MAG: hypothetical protein IKU15_05965 [Clostridia bacterium]|nr:hypothetical protein [Clostridia bacterium]